MENYTADFVDHWAYKNPALADQYRAEAIRCRNLLGFNSQCNDVLPSDLGKAIIDLTQTAATFLPGELSYRNARTLEFANGWNACLGAIKTNQQSTKPVKNPKN